MGKMRRFLQDGAVFAYSLGDLQDIRDRYTITGAPTIVNSPYGNALNFADENDYITLTAEEEYNLRFDSGAQDFSVVAWVRRAAIGANHVIIDKRDAGTDGWVFFLGSTNIIRFRLNAAIADSADTITDDAWHCVAAVIDRSANITIYLDGVATGAPLAIAGPAMATTATPIISSIGAVLFFDGDIHAIIIYDRVLTPDEVLDLATHKAFDY